MGPTRSATHSARLFAAPDHNSSGWSRRWLESLHAQQIRFFRIGLLVRFAKFTAENVIGSKSEAKSLNRIPVGNSLVHVFLETQNYKNNRQKSLVEETLKIVGLRPQFPSIRLVTYLLPTRSRVSSAHHLDVVTWLKSILFKITTGHISFTYNRLMR